MTGRPADQAVERLSIDPVEELLVAHVIVHGPPERWIRTYDDARAWARRVAASIRRRAVQ